MMRGVAPDVAKRLSEARLKITMNVIYIGGNMPTSEKVTYSKETIFNRPYAKKAGCSLCKCRFEKSELFVVKETKLTWFRGDDEVEFFCTACIPENVLKLLKLKRRTHA